VLIVTLTMLGANTLHTSQRKQRVQDMSLMLSEPLHSSSSDTKSFDEEDMYGFDSDIEIISLASGSNQVQASPDHMVCRYIDCRDPYHITPATGSPKHR